MSRMYDVFPSFPSLNSTVGAGSPASAAAHALHRVLPPSLEPFFFLSYPIISRSRTQPPTSSSSATPTILYGKGPADACFVLASALTLTIAREVMVRYVLAGLARWYLSRMQRTPPSSSPMTKAKKERARRKREHAVSRFAEQGWSFLYCTCAWSLGAYILSQLSSPFSPQSLWATYPVTPLPGLTKFYYLGQLGWWFHQLYVINTEKRRHDHWQMFSHHILTIALVVASYIGNFTRVGTIIHFLMDFCDIWLPLAKMFRYLSLTSLCDGTFVIFLVSWLFTRQIGLAYVIYTSWFDLPKIMPYRWSPATEYYLTVPIQNTFLAMLVLLLALASVWFYMACRVAVRVLRGLGAEDSRSDDEDEDEVHNDGKQAEPAKTSRRESNQYTGKTGSGSHVALQDPVLENKDPRPNPASYRNGRTTSPTGSAASASTSTSSDQASPAYSESGDEVELVTPRGVAALNVGARVPEALKGLQCKRDFTRDDSDRVRRRK